MVLDASVVVSFLIDADTTPQAIRAVLADDDAQPIVCAPQLLDLEVANALRGLRRARRLTGRGADEAMEWLGRARIARYPHTGLMGRVWELRDRLTPYDAAYVTLAEALGMPLVTHDAALARATGHRADIRLIG